jgi:CelD/BcsL family acetyltransferase involved in cellulose biosynthesis
VFLTHEWFLSWWDNLCSQGHLDSYLVRDEKDRLLGIAPLMKKKQTLFFLASEEVTDYCDFICLQGKEKQVVHALLDYITQQQDVIQQMELIHIQEDSPSLNIFSNLASEVGLFCRIKESEVTPRLKLPSSYEDYLSSLPRKSRHELRRKIRRLEQIDKFDIRILKDPEGLRESLKTFIHLHKKSSPEKHNFWKTQGMEGFFSDVTINLAKQGWAELLLLCLEDRTIAALLNFTYEDEVAFYNVAYEQEFSSKSPGFYLFHHSIQQAIQEKKKTVDFLRGSEKYKYDFGAKSSKIFNLYLEFGATQR